jgi:hypothetical protein
MELGHFQLQFFVSSLVIVCAAVAALICDFLKRNNDQLRELTIELKIRHEEEQKRAYLMSPHAVPEAAVPNVAVPNVTAPKQRSAAGQERKRTVNSEALAAMERGAVLAGTGMRPPSNTPAPVTESKPAPTPEAIVVSPEQKPSAAKKDWGSLLSRSAQKPAATVNKDLPVQLVAATNHSMSAQAADDSIPAGFHDGFVLNSLVQSRQPITGLVVSIGVKADGNLPQSVHELVQSLIGPNDFAAQSSDDEFLLIYPQEQGASAQRRLSEIAQQLWDFQLRSLGSFQILFSWGGVEVRSESIAEAIASASERMQETRRGRKLLTMWSPAPSAETLLRRAV